MQIRRLDEKTIALEDLDPFGCQLLQDIPQRADPAGNAAAEARLFSSPTHGAEPDADADWKEYVEPDLRELFLDAVGVVKRDLAGFPPAGEKPPHELHLPVMHLDAWVHAMNQARLALAAKFAFTEDEMEERMTLDSDARSRALFEVRFYGLLQEFFLRQLESETE